jgi:hypothetical protein
MTALEAFVREASKNPLGLSAIKLCPEIIVETHVRWGQWITSTDLHFGLLTAQSTELRSMDSTYMNASHID